MKLCKKFAVQVFAIAFGFAAIGQANAWDYDERICNVQYNQCLFEANTAQQRMGCELKYYYCLNPGSPSDR